jgi:hypothetical protein
MKQAVKKLRKLKAALDKIEEKEDEILLQIDEAIEELEDSDGLPPRLRPKSR